ncbi:MAG: hypothetical protein HZA78_03115 [Candidatus Schekmanbacteria bacterium]|nr:hypothetical protein [Candidatus Schekmanbacteria bacterium]
MAKKHREKITLFPFLDIMTSTMGTLLLVLISTTLFSAAQETKKVYLKIKAEQKGEGAKTPYFIVCEEERIVILPFKMAVPVDQLDAENSFFLDFTNRLDRARQYIIFAVRPNGIESFKKARRLAEDLNIDIGYEPVEQGWQIEIEKSLEKEYGAPQK